MLLQKLDRRLRGNHHSLRQVIRTTLVPQVRLNNLVILSSSNNLRVIVCSATKRVEEEKPGSIGRWSDHDDDDVGEEAEIVDDGESTEVTTTYLSPGRVTPPASTSSRRSNSNGVLTPTQNKMSTRNGSVVAGRRNCYLVAIISLILFVVLL